MKTGFSVFVIVALALGCRDPAAPKVINHTRLISVSKLEAPATIPAGAPVDVVLTVEVGGCVGFDHISAVRDGSLITLAAWGREAQIPPGAGCMAYLMEEPHTYRLDPPFPRNFTIVVQPIQFGVLLTRDVQVQ